MKAVRTADCGNLVKKTVELVRRLGVKERIWCNGWQKWWGQRKRKAILHVRNERLIWVLVIVIQTILVNTALTVSEYSYRVVIVVRPVDAVRRAAHCQTRSRRKHGTCTRPQHADLRCTPRGCRLTRPASPASSLTRWQLHPAHGTRSRSPGYESRRRAPVTATTESRCPPWARPLPAALELTVSLHSTVTSSLITHQSTCHDKHRKHLNGNNYRWHYLQPVLN